MYINSKSAIEINQLIIKAAAAKAGNLNKLAKLVGMNSATCWRTSAGVGALNSKALLAVILFLGWDEAEVIVEDYISQNKLGAVKDYFE